MDLKTLTPRCVHPMVAVALCGLSGYGLSGPLLTLALRRVFLWIASWRKSTTISSRYMN
jgi:hypothetical protein